MKLTSYISSKLIILLLAVSAVLFSQGTALKVGGYPTSLATGVPVSISSGVGAATVNVVTGIEISDRSTLGWTLTITSANSTGAIPQLQHTITGSSIDYSLEANYVSGTLAAGLTMVPAFNTPLTFSGGSAIITTTGSTTQRTRKYIFDLRMTIADAATIGKLAGNYTDQLTLVLASND